MRPAVCEDLPPLGVVLEEHDDFAGYLNDLDGHGVKKNTWYPRWKTTVVNRIVRFREGNTMRPKRRLCGFVLRFAPCGHGRFLQIELIDPVLEASGSRGTVFHPDSGDVRRGARSWGVRPVGWLCSLSGCHRRTTQDDREGKGYVRGTISHFETPCVARI